VTQPTPTIVFDFDHTLTAWDSADRFFRWLLWREPWRAAMVIAALPVLAPLLLARRTRKLPVRFAIWVATLGRADEDVCTLVHRHVRELVVDAPRLVLADGIAQLERHLAQGHRVVVATGSLEVLARAYLDHAGLQHVPVVGSTLRPLLWGMVSREHCFGPRKIPMLTARGYAPPWATTYTDHECDLPVIAHSAECFLVNPKPRAVRVVGDRLAATPTILAWR
jgi:phosphatidylglycerophosphatase C